MGPIRLVASLLGILLTAMMSGCTARAGPSDHPVEPIKLPKEAGISVRIENLLSVDNDLFGVRRSKRQTSFSELGGKFRRTGCKEISSAYWWVDSCRKSSPKNGRIIAG